MRILFQENGREGVFYHRQFVPHVVMTEFYAGKAEIKIDREADISKIPLDILATYDIFVLHGRVDIDVIGKIKKLGKKFVYDADDYFYCTPERHFYNEWKLLSHAFVIEGHIMDADLVTCTSDILAGYIKKHTGVIAQVLPNAIGENDPQFMPIETKSERLRFGFVGGSSHVADTEIIGRAITRLYREFPEYRDKWQIVFGGFDTSHYAVDTKGIRRSIKQKDLNSVRIEKYLTGDYSIIEPKYLDQFKRLENVENTNTQYRRIWARDIQKYATIYNEVDVALAPLCDNTFNRCKSNLKIVEAGWMGKEVIASDLGTFKDGKTDSQLMLCSSTDEWLGAMLSHLENFISSGEPIRSQLPELVREHYNAKNFAEKRYELYKALL